MGLPYGGVILLIYGFYICGGEDPSVYCKGEKPFRLGDNTCADFADICLKNNLDCINFQKTCKQCPPSNYSVIMYLDIMNLKKQLNITNSNLADLRNQLMLVSKNNPKQTNNILIICSVSLALFLIMHFIMMLEYRFKIITKFCQHFNRKDTRYQILYSRKRDDNNQIMNRVDLNLKEIRDYVQESQKQNLSNHQELLKTFNKYRILPSNGLQYDELESPCKDVKPTKLHINFYGEDHESILLEIDFTSNILQMRQEICEKLSNTKYNDYQKMKLKYNGIILNDDNQYSLENINPLNTIVNCFIDSSMNASDIVVVKLRVDFSVSCDIEINKNQTADHLMNLIGKIIDLKDFSIFKEIIEKKEYELLTSDLIKNMQYGDFIHAISKKSGKLVIRSIFDDDTSVAVEYENIETVSSVLKKIQYKFSFDLEYFSLFYNDIFIDERKFLFEFENSQVKFCHIQKSDGLIKDKQIERGEFWELSFATDTINNKKLLLKKYLKLNLDNWKTEDWMLNELKIFLFTKSQPRFIQLNGVYMNETTLYVAMENMAGGTLRYYLRNNKEFDKQVIVKWIAQIVEALKFLHKNNIIHRDLNPSNLLVDENIDLKLSNFNLSKYVLERDVSSILERSKKQSQIKYRYMAPEILGGGVYNSACDIWSFGAVLVRIVTGKKPFPKLSKDQAKMKISECSTIAYEFPNKSCDKQIKSIIDSCLKRDPKDRCTIDKLIENYSQNNN